MKLGSVGHCSLLSALVLAGCNAISGIGEFTFDGGAGGEGGRGSATSGAGGDASGSGGDASGAGGEPSGAGGEPSGAGGACGGDSCPAPTGVVLEFQTYTVLRGQTMAGTPVMDPCPEGQVIVGYRGLLGGLAMSEAAIHGQIQAQCARLSLTGSDPYTITTTPDGVTPGRGTYGDVPWEMMCPENYVVVGFSGRSGSFLDYLAIDCAPLLVTGERGDYRVEVGVVTSPEGVGGDGGTVFLDTRCGEGQVANAAYVIDETAAISAFGMGCARVSLSY